jgi:hypothetical protein
VFDLALAVRPAVLAAAALLVVAPAARAQFAVRREIPTGRATKVYEWRGRVDREIRLQLRDDGAAVYRVGSREGQVGSGRVLRAIPQQGGQLSVERLEGRGIVDVVQQPSQGNDYTAVLRLRDPSSGAGSYHIVAYWRPTEGLFSGTDDDGRDRDGDWRDDRRGRDRDDRYDGDWRDRDGVGSRAPSLGAYLRGIPLSRAQAERVDRVWDSRASRDERLAKIRTVLTRDQRPRFDSNRAQLERKVVRRGGRR